VNWRQARTLTHSGLFLAKPNQVSNAEKFIEAIQARAVSSWRLPGKQAVTGTRPGNNVVSLPQVGALMTASNLAQL